MSCPEKDGPETCGRPPFATGSNLCEKHYAPKYPVTYERLKREIECHVCRGTGMVMDTRTERSDTCGECQGRGQIDPRHARMRPPARSSEPQQLGDAAKKAFDP